MTPRAVPGAAKAEGAAEAFARHDPYWPAQLSVLATIALDLDLPNTLTLLPVWVLPAFESLLLAGLVVTTPRGKELPRPGRRSTALVLIGLVSAANVLSLVLLVHYLLHHQASPAEGHRLILAGVEIWVTNVLLFGVWYWELDRGGPQARKHPDCPTPDFLFPQMTEERLGRWDWRGGFVDYLYVSFTNASAFSPTDTMPLSVMAKMLMLVQSLISLVTIGLVVARAVNILQ
ncbi:MAG TPA: hypothetical protein VHM72_08700 [Solirubrobacteraceae bacterium]|jgi:uncharacterized membrane protein|nr:hypothetical protein [Solirubrobacteraceae bacterium]